MLAHQAGDTSSPGARRRRLSLALTGRGGLVRPGPQVVPFTAQKQNAVIAGVANTLGEGVLASDVSLAVLQDAPQAGSDALAATGRRLRQLAVVQGVVLALNVTTGSAEVLQQRARLQAAAGPPYELASHIGAQGLTTTSLLLLDARVVLLPLVRPAEAPAAPLAVAAASQAQVMAIPASIGGVPTWVVGTLSAIAALLVVSLACICGCLLVRWCRKRRAERVHADYVSKYFADVSQPSAAAAATAAAGAGQNCNSTTANPAFRLAAVPAGGDTGVKPAARYVLPGLEPKRTADVPVRPARRLQMARPDRAVLQTEPPPPLGASAALEAAEAAANRT
ncbi:hypothetical protein WJX81_000026 [Elliptochloris bilobata]|uniref:Uncharacterized protein n=1 Tax=Elliptochloris bilobata TaxID=381761 RepID=A0AAW1RUB3_9CHLO